MKNAGKQHTNNISWMNRLKFYKDEIQIYIRFLSKNNRIFSNGKFKKRIPLLIKELKKIEEKSSQLLRSINTHEHYLYEMIEGTEIDVSIIFPMENSFAEEEIIALENEYKDLKKRFLLFAKRHLQN